MSLLGKTLLRFTRIFPKLYPKPKVDTPRLRGKLYYQVLAFYVLFYDIACKVELNYASRYPNVGNLYDVRDCRVFRSEERRVGKSVG